MQQEEEQYSCLEEFFVDSCRFGDFDDAIGCFEDNVDITWLDINQNNCIHMVSANGHVNILKEIIKYAIEKKVNLSKLLNHQNSYGCTPLHWATINNQLQIIQILLENGADLTIKNQNNFTCLDEAVQLNKIEVLEFLSKYSTMTEDQQLSFQEASESEEKDDQEIE